METILKVATLKQVRNVMMVIAENINKKVNKFSTLYGYGITDAYLKSEFDGYIKSFFAGKESIEKLEEYQNLKTEMSENNYKVPVDEVGLKIIDGTLRMIINE